MRTIIVSHPRFPFSTFIALFVAGCNAPATGPAPDAATVATAPSEPAFTAVAVPLQDLDYAGDQSALVALDRDITAARADAKKLAAIEARLIALLRRPDGSSAARQAACQRLGAIFALGGPPSSAALDALKAMLLDQRQADIARLALESAPGVAIDRVLIEALGPTTGRTRLGLIQTIATRAPAAAVPALGALLNDKDAATAAAAATALGQIGNAAALAALRSAPDGVRTVVTAKLNVARQLATADGVALFSELQRDARLAPHQRAAALRGLLDLEPAAAAARISEVLSGDEWVAKQAAIEAIFAAPAPGLIATLAAKLPAWDAPTQAAVLAAFGRRAEAAATPAIVAAIKHPDQSVRAEAISALGCLPGNRELVTLLANLALGENFDEAKLARASLARLNGPEVSAAVLVGAERGAAARRVVFIEQLALRNLTEGLPFLRACRQEADASVRTAAIGALGDLAAAADGPLILDWAAAATDSAEQSRALRSLVSVTLRNPDTAQRARPIYQLLEKAAPATAVRLLPVLPRFGGKESAECAGRLALSTDATVADAATGILARWLDRTALPSLITAAAKATVASARTAASQAALRYFERNREAWSAEQTAQLAQLLGGATDAAIRQRMVKLLNRAADKDALALAEKLQSEPALAAVAQEAARCIGANLAGPPRARASGNEDSLKFLFDGKTSTQWRVPVTPDQWVEVDFRQSRPLHRLTLDETGRTADYPERYEIFVTDDPSQPGKAIASGAGQRNRTVVDFPAATHGRYVLIKNTAERADANWTISELFVD
ncbi:MAG: discoidin domain-containing protein [Opitutus sp.]|nr:discoidin domain-containing protein [Opitutus sp.]